MLNKELLAGVVCVLAVFAALPILAAIQILMLS